MSRAGESPSKARSPHPHPPYAAAQRCRGDRGGAARRAALVACIGGGFGRPPAALVVHGLIGHSFSAGSVELRLVSVSDVAGAKHERTLAGSENAFVLTFSGSPGTPLDSGTHRLWHRTLGTFELFLSPVERPRTDRRYEAVVDRSVPA